MKEMLEKPLPVNKQLPRQSQEPTYPPIERRAATFDPKALQRLLDGDNAEIRNSVKQLITQPEFRYYNGNDVAAQQETSLSLDQADCRRRHRANCYAPFRRRRRECSQVHGGV